MNLNETAYGILSSIAADRRVHESAAGKVTVLDAGVVKRPPLSSALKIAEASLGGLGKVTLDDDIHVSIPKMPAVATLGCQLAGWKVDFGGASALGSGPARLLAKKPEKIVSKLDYCETSQKAALLLESRIFPDAFTLDALLKDAAVRDLIIAVFAGDSLTGLVNVLARVVEVGVFRLHKLGYDTNRITSAEGSVPFLNLGKDSMFEANDAIIYHGAVSLTVEGWDPSLTARGVSRNSEAFGKPFSQIFDEADGNFYDIPADIFAPAKLSVKDTKTGETYIAP
jgi:methenyltetrahydromethanopterin cyclohydrolase